jgi:hypothetical protein
MNDLTIHQKLDQVIDLLTPKEKIIPEQIIITQLCELFGKSINWHTKIRATRLKVQKLGFKKGRCVYYNSTEIIKILNEMGYEIKK